MTRSVLHFAASASQGRGRVRSVRNDGRGPPGASAPTARARLEFLDALRGLAAVYVLVYHMLLLPQPNLVAPLWAQKFAMAGGTGVTLFFIVSAFSLYYTMPLRALDGRPVLSFYLHRFFRIAPLFYFWIIASMVRDYWEFGATHDLIGVLSQITFTFNLIPGRQEGFVWAGWTIGVEMVFYAVFPLVYRYVRRTGNAVALVFAMLLLWSVVQLVLDYSTMPAEWKNSILKWSSLRHFPIFAVGVIVYHVFVHMPAERVDGGDFRSLGNALLFGGIFGYLALLQGWLPDVFGDMYYWQGPVFGAIFIGLALAPWSLVVNRVTAFLGKVSYSVYLNHTTAIYFLQPVYRRIYDAVPSLTMAFLAALLLTLLVVLPVSALTFRFIEKPGITMGRTMMRKIAGGTSGVKSVQRQDQQTKT